MLAEFLIAATCLSGEVKVRQPEGHPLAGAVVCVKRRYVCDRICKEQRRVRRRVRYQRRIVAPYRAKLNRMAWCESNQRWGIATGNGYYGGLQFDPPTWRSVGGTGLPHWHTQLEQMYRAVLLIQRRGYQPWPVCGYV